MGLALTDENRPTEQRESDGASETLQQMSYFITHELPPPLRTIQLACRHLSELQEQTSGEAPSVHQEQIDRVLEATRLLRNVFDDLTWIARMASTSLRKEWLDLGPIVREIFEQYSDGKTTLRVEGTTIAFGDRKLVLQAINELIDNAVTFNRNPGQRIIEFRSQQVDGKAVFSVSDNGNGFDMQYHDRIFRPFERLESRALELHRGMGLARFARIIELHGGRFWADSIPGVGSCFSFTLFQ